MALTSIPYYSYDDNGVNLGLNENVNWWYFCLSLALIIY